MLSKMASYVEAIVDDEFSKELFENVMAQNSTFFFGPKKTKIARAQKIDVDYWSTSWGRWMQDKEIQNPNSKLAKLFQLRFRVPFYLFQGSFVPKCKDFWRISYALQGYSS